MDAERPDAGFSFPSAKRIGCGLACAALRQATLPLEGAPLRVDAIVPKEVSVAHKPRKRDASRIATHAPSLIRRVASVVWAG